MPAKERMRCPQCGAAMNHHADKLLQTGSTDTPHYDAALAGESLEMHTCPACGASASRPASGG
jgi:ribosomal protein S27AE